MATPQLLKILMKKWYRIVNGLPYPFNYSKIAECNNFFKTLSHTSSSAMDFEGRHKY